MIDETNAIKAVLKVYKKCNIKQFPIDCMAILKEYGLYAVPYSSLPNEKQQACLALSHDAFLLNKTVFYNDRIKHVTRIRFSLMHELGHYLLKHKGNDINQEREADAFASYLLAPRIDIYLSWVKDVDVAAKRYQISETAAQIAFKKCNFNRIMGMRVMTYTETEKAIGKLLGLFPKPEKKKAVVKKIRRNNAAWEKVEAKIEERMERYAELGISYNDYMFAKLENEKLYGFID